MQTYINPAKELWGELCLRPSSDNPVIEGRVKAIISRVKASGDEALRQLSLEIDKRELQDIEVSAEEIAEAKASVSEDVKTAITNAASNIRAFHKAQMPKAIELETAPGVKCIQKPVAIPRVGLYIPGGTAPLFSTVLMLAIPASLAGCGTVILCTPTGKNRKVSPEVLYAADYCGIQRIFKIGGAQAIASMAYGTETVPKVDKIFGPGNQYVTKAKQLLAGGTVAIDMPAGPSEVMVIADKNSDPEYVAADLLSQAEHGVDSQVMLVCNTESMADKVGEAILRQTEVLSRADLAKQALEKSRFVVFDNLEDSVEFANTYAPEHLIISTEAPWIIASRITSAGSVFIGKYTPESAGDYASGTNHTLPTCGWARSFSGVNMDSYMRKMTLQEITKEGLKGLSDTIVAMAEAEGLQAHANAVKVRMK